MRRPAASPRRGRCRRCTKSSPSSRRRPSLRRGPRRRRRLPRPPLGGTSARAGMRTDAATTAQRERNDNAQGGFSHCIWCSDVSHGARMHAYSLMAVWLALCNSLLLRASNPRLRLWLGGRSPNTQPGVRRFFIDHCALLVGRPVRMSHGRRVSQELGPQRTQSQKVRLWFRQQVCRSRQIS